jgi:hypothetical protein
VTIRWPVWVALTAGVSSLAAAVIALFRLLPPILVPGAPLVVKLDGMPIEDLSPWDPRLLTAMIVLASLGGLVVVFFTQILQPKAGVQVRRGKGDVAARGDVAP